MLTKRRIDLIPLTKKPQKLRDGDGLYLFISEHGAKSWRSDYRYSGVRRTITYGRYPDVTLDDARDRHRAAKKQLREGIDPSHAKKLDKLAQRADIGETFELVANAWFASKAHRRSPIWQQAHTLNLQRDLLAGLGKIPIRTITEGALQGVLEKAAARSGPKTAERVRQTAVQIFDYARRKLRVTGNLARDLAGTIEVPPVVHRAYLKESELPAFLAALEQYPGFPSTRLAVELLFRTIVRKTELTEARWSEFDLRNGLWTIPAARMKMPTEQKSNRHNDHEVPLSTQAVRLLRHLRPLTAGSKFLFPSNSTIDKPMSSSTLNMMFKRMGYAKLLTPHGIRATASTILNERGFRGDVIERQLAHLERNEIRAAYNHAKYLSERRELLQAWSDILDEMRGAPIYDVFEKVAR